jgi:protein-S-isoprenylcysteine O-methyltransferase Ste14
MYFLFVAAHVSTGRRTGQWATLAPIVIQESLFAVFLLVRRPTIAVSARPLEWIVAMVAMLLSFMLRPTTYVGPLVTVGLPLQMVGLVAAIVAVVFLGRSVGIVPADRGIRTNGMYRMIRHPIYASYVVAYVGYVITYPTARNAMIVAATVIAMNMRAIFEERLLGRDERYREYLRRTPWRFLPYLY